ncbi:MAG TPA: AAA family ATPase, partial [Clostridiales bacterium]|nr:AAA family ATPase [Clostridiales bacterium]
MLQTLKIENIAIIESAVINFDAGLNVLTGETGAGKSIIIDSINAILGERTSRELIRTGANQAKVSALFTQIGSTIRTKLESLGLSFQDDDCLLLQRTLAPDGKNICFANGEPVTVGILKKIGPDLINIHGQHDSQALLQSDGHYLYIDALAGNSNILIAYKDVYERLKAAEKELAEITTDQAEKERMLDVLNFQIDELEKAELVVGEQEELINRKNLFRNSEKVLQKLTEAQAYLSGQEEFDGAVRLLEMTALALSNASQYYPELEKNAEKVRDLAYALEEHVDAVNKGLDLVEFDPQEYEMLEERLDTLYRLSRKYGEGEEEMLNFLEQAKKQRDKIVFSDERANELNIIINKLKIELLNHAEA